MEFFTIPKQRCFLVQLEMQNIQKFQSSANLRETESQQDLFKSPIKFQCVIVSLKT